MFVDTEAWLARYDRGEFCFDSSADVYGELAAFFGHACISEHYVRDWWSQLFEVIEYRNDLIDQPVIVARKGNSNSPS